MRKSEIYARRRLHRFHTQHCKLTTRHYVVGYISNVTAVTTLP